MRFRYAVVIATALVVALGFDEFSGQEYRVLAQSREEPIGIGTQIEGLEMRMYDDITPSAEGQKPTFFIRAKSAEGNEKGGWQFVQPQAILYGQDSEDVQLNAETGIVDDQKTVATLSGDVVASLGKMTMKLDTILWDNQTQHARSDSDVLVTGDQLDLRASGLHIMPKDGNIILENVSGTISLEGK